MDILDATYFQINPITRGAIWAGVAYVFMEFLKPGFAYSIIGNDYYPRSFKQDTDLPEEGGAVVPGTSVPWWTVPLAFFVVFGLFI